MRRQKQSPLDAPEYVPSTTRAVAWGAMFFAVLAFIISCVTLLLTYKDGRLVGNVNLILREARKTLDKVHARAANDEQAVQQDKVRQQLERYVNMIQQGDGQVRFYLDGLRGDLEKLSNYASEDAAKWLGDATATVDAARQELRENAPNAARKLRDLANRLRTTVAAVRDTDADLQASPKAGAP